MVELVRKSTIATALFRLRELTSGKILVDGVDVAKLGLRDVRGRPNGLAIITQDPLVFSGPIRFTLDPLTNIQTKKFGRPFMPFRCARRSLSFGIIVGVQEWM